MFFTIEAPSVSPSPPLLPLSNSRSTAIYKLPIDRHIQTPIDLQVPYLGPHTNHLQLPNCFTNSRSTASGCQGCTLTQGWHPYTNSRSIYKLPIVECAECAGRALCAGRVECAGRAARPLPSWPVAAPNPHHRCLLFTAGRSRGVRRVRRARAVHGSCGMRELMRGLGVRCAVTLKTDASAAKSIASRILRV